MQEDDLPIYCPHPLDAVYWNPWNKVIQCHKCGTVMEITMSTDPTEFIEGEVSGGDSEEEDDGDTSEVGEVQATDETGVADPSGNESSVGE